MPVPGPGYSITVRVEAPPSASAAGDLTGAIGHVGGVITAFDVVESHADRIVVDISCNAVSAVHAKDITDALEALPGVAVRKVSDRTFLMHLGGKLEVTPKVSLRNRDDILDAMDVFENLPDPEDMDLVVDLVQPNWLMIREKSEWVVDLSMRRQNWGSIHALETSAE